MMYILRLWPVDSAPGVKAFPWLTHIPCNSVDSAVRVGRMIEAAAEEPYRWELLVETHGGWEVVARSEEIS